MDIRPGDVLLLPPGDARVPLRHFPASFAERRRFSDLISSKLALQSGRRLARGPPRSHRRRAAIYLEMAHGGARPNSGGARINSGGARPGAGRPPAIKFQLSDVLGWYVVRTEFDRERSVDIAIRLIGVTVFNPSIYRPPSPARRDRSGIMRPARPATITSMFPRFMFAHLNLSDPSWHAIKRLQGVERFMGRIGNSGIPAQVPDAKIAQIRSFLEPNECCYPSGHPDLKHTPIEIGTAQRLLTGALEGHEGICLWSDSKRVKLLMTILGRSEVWADVTDVEAV